MTQGNVPVPERKFQETMYRLFQKFALEDQRKYYQNAVNRYRKSAAEINRLRATFALITGLASALAGLIAAVWLNSVTCTAPGIEEGISRPGLCGAMQAAAAFLTILAVVAPAIGAAFTTLGDLYQWDRLTSIYTTALENLEVADANSPVDEMGDVEYRAAFRAFSEGALEVMRNETAQWGQVSQPPAQLEKFIREERRRARDYGGDPDIVPGREPEPDPNGGGQG